MEKKLIKRKIRTSKTNFVLHKSYRKCLFNRKEDLRKLKITPRSQRLVSHRKLSTWSCRFQYKFNEGNYANNQRLKQSHELDRSTTPTILYNLFDRIGNPFTPFVTLCIPSTRNVTPFTYLLRTNIMSPSFKLLTLKITT